MVKINNINLTYEQISFICGGLLGDLGLQFWGKNWRIRSGTQVDRDWLFKQYEILKEFVQTPPKLDKNGKWYFNTLTIPALQEVDKLWYPNATKESVGIKVMPYLWIQDNFNDISLATLFMGDGSKRDSGYIFCLDNFTREEVIWFGQFLKDKYELNNNQWTKDNKPRLYIPANSRDKLTQIVLPYMVESQKRKLFL